MADRFISNFPHSIPSLEATKGETFTDVVGSPYYVAPEVVKYYTNIMVKRQIFGVQELQFSKACFIPLDYESISQISFDSNHIKPACVSSTKPDSNRGVCDGSRHSYNSIKRTFTMEQIYKATTNFCPSLKIGQGCFGIVYKGTLDDGTLVAIKRAKKGSYDDHMRVEFQREIEMLSKVKHLSLVRLLEFLEEGDEWILVVEYVPNESLREHLDGKRGDLLDFSVRLDVAVDLAHAIIYLHTYIGTYNHPTPSSQTAAESRWMTSALSDWQRL